MEAKESIKDLIIIGGGVAGLAAALRCIQKGISFTIILADLKYLDSPFQATPSESVHPGIETLLEMFSLRTLLETVQRGTYQGIVTNEGFNPLSVNKDWKGYHLDKPLFLKGLYANLLLNLRSKYLIMDKVTNLRLKGSHYEVSTKSNKTFEARFIIDASGRSQIAGKLLKRKKTYYSESLTCVTGLVSNIPDHLYKSLSTSFFMNNSGWTWLAPETNNCCTWTTLSMTNLPQVNLPKELRACNDAAVQFSRNVRWRLYDQPAFEGIVLAGEAAGIIDPASGQGIIFAFMAGVMAADATGKHLFSTESHHLIRKEYNEWYRSFFIDKTILLKQIYDSTK